MRIGKTNHFWTYLPELGQKWVYCDRCKKARQINTHNPKTFVTYKRALRLINENDLSKNEVKAYREAMTRNYK